VSRSAARAALVLAVTLSIGLTGCGRLAAESPAPSAPVASDTAVEPSPAATVDLTAIESELDGIDSLLDESNSDLADAKDAESQEQ
jgi:hypothetical protein